MQPTTFPQTYLVQFSFHFDETQRLIALARNLSEDAYHAKIDYSYASIHNTFAHLLNASELWRNVMENTPPVMIAAESIAGIDELAALFEIERKEWQKLIATFDAATLLTTIERQTPFGAVTLPVWQTLQHVILHGMGHHTELARMLSEAGQAPGDVDFLFYHATESTSR